MCGTLAPWSHHRRSSQKSPPPTEGFLKAVLSPNWVARLWAIKTPLLQTGWSVVWNLQGSGLCIAYLDIIGACVSRFNRESREAECVQMRLHCRIHTADARFANDWSAYGSAQANRPAFPWRVLYCIQPLCCGIRLPGDWPSSAIAKSLVEGKSLKERECGKACS